MKRDRLGFYRNSIFVPVFHYGNALNLYQSFENHPQYVDVQGFTTGVEEAAVIAEIAGAGGEAMAIGPLGTAALIGVAAYLAYDVICRLTEDPKNKICCCVEDILETPPKKIGPYPRINEKYKIGHEFTITPILKYKKGEQRGNCIFRWYEKTNNPAWIEVDGRRPVSDAWFDFRAEQTNIAFNKDDDEIYLIPYSSIWKASPEENYLLQEAEGKGFLEAPQRDRPQISIANKEIRYRYLDIRAVVYSTIGCKCKYKSVEISYHQELESINGVPGRWTMPPGTKKYD